MIRKELAKRISALMLTFMLTLSMSGFAFEDVFASTEEEAAQAQQIATEESIDNAEQPAAGAAAETATEAEAAPAEQIGVQTEEPAADTGAEAAEEAAEEPAPEEAVPADEEIVPLQPEEELLGEEAMMAVPAPITITEYLITNAQADIRWNAVPDAASYKVFCNGAQVAAVVVPITDASGLITELKGTILYLQASTEYTFRIEAYGADGSIIAGSDDLVLRTKRTLPASINNAVKLPSGAGVLNLREIIGEDASGYSVVQGSCTDGKGYAYYMMVSSANQMGRVAKIRLADSTLMGVSEVFDVYHGNGMCYDSKRNRLVSCTYHDSRQRVYFINPDTLASMGTANVRFDNYKGAGADSISANDRKKGLTAIAYNSTYDCYVSMLSSYHDIVIYDAETLQAIGKACTKVTADYPKVWQSMDADDEYVYFLLSKGGSEQPNNIVLCLDWHSEKLAQMKEQGKTFIEKSWNCGTGDGRPTTVIKLGVPYEIESMFHVPVGNGLSSFYLSEYHSDPSYKTVTKKVKYKKKWKKVWKKVKWKKVKKKGKWKWKYKKKKVWKYKTKYKTVTTQEKYNAKQNYVYNLGIF
ncbi:MAG: hypothetical protein IJI11_06475 [Mogibacterium sp.]|nr:hypothetical protein [Mogibacterium sp.]